MEISDGRDLITECFTSYSLPKSILFQYTSAPTLKSIYDNNCLWITECHFLNDDTELAHGMDIFIKELRKQFRLNEIQNISRYIKFLTELRKSGSMKFFVGSFTENGNSLLHWKKYGDNEKGLAIGFDPYEMPETIKGLYFQWMKVEYNRKHQRRDVESIVKIFIRRFKEVLGANNGYPDYRARDLLIALIQIIQTNSIRYKNFSWSNENEWRFVIIGNHPGANWVLRKRERNKEIIEFLELPINTSMIKKVHIGPKTDFELEKSNIQKLFAGNVEIRKSEPI